MLLHIKTTLDGWWWKGGGKGNIDGMKGGWSVIDDTIRLTQRCTTAPVRDHSRRLRLFFTSISSEKEKKWLLNPYGRREKQQRRRRRRRRLEVKSYFRKREEFGSCGFGSGVYVTKNWSFQSDLTPAKIYNFQRFDDRRSSKAEKGGIESFRCCKERTLKDIKCMRETQKESYKYVDSEGRNETYLMKER